MTSQVGFIEINSGEVQVRGRFVAAGGTFSGKFSADSIEVVERIHMNYGGVAPYTDTMGLYADAPNPDGYGNTVSEYPVFYAPVVQSPVAGVTIFFTMEGYGGTYYGNTLGLYRNDVLLMYVDGEGYYTNEIGTSYYDSGGRSGDKYQFKRIVGDPSNSGYQSWSIPDEEYFDSSGTKSYVLRFIAEINFA